MVRWVDLVLPAAVVGGELGLHAVPAADFVGGGVGRAGVQTAAPFVVGQPGFDHEEARAVLGGQGLARGVALWVGEGRVHDDAQAQGQLPRRDLPHDAVGQLVAVGQVQGEVLDVILVDERPAEGGDQGFGERGFAGGGVALKQE